MPDAGRPNDWARDAVFYHVYPLGLLGAPRDNGLDAPLEPRLERLRTWIPHLRELGVDALYLGPLFESGSHGYDTIDYYRVDRRLGTDETLRGLVDALHAAGIRVVFDAVLNHVGRRFWAFRDLLERGPASPYRGWFRGVRFDARSPLGDPFVYDAWQGSFDLVKLEHRNAAVREHLFGAVRHWLADLGADGLRLDAADAIDLDFLAELAGFSRSVRPDVWLLGEVIHGDYREWANASTLDSVTNYEAHKGLWSSLVDHNYFEIAYALEREFGQRGIYRDLPLYNFVDNHDVDRVASRLPRSELLAPLYGLLFTMPGVPAVYAGSEWGLTGSRSSGDDSALRPALDPASAARDAAAPWLAGFVARLAAIRHELAPLRRGSYRQLHVDHEQFAFVRARGPERVIVALNAADGETRLDLALPGGGAGRGGGRQVWRDRLADASTVASAGRIRIDLRPFSAAVLVPAASHEGRLGASESG